MKHILEQRTEDEVLWTRRRDVLRSVAGFLALGTVGTVGTLRARPAWAAQTQSNIVQLTGDVLLNGARLLPEQVIQTGDELQTGADASLTFVLGSSAFHVRQNSRLRVDRGRTLNFVSVLHLFAGAVASVWERGGSRLISTPTLTAGIRGTGVYTEVLPNQRTYFCNCYGTVDLQAGSVQLRSQSDYHQSFWAEPEPRDGRVLTPAAALNHTDEELEFLAGLIGQRTAWQIAGKKGKKDGRGYLEEGLRHPAEMLGR